MTSPGPSATIQSRPLLSLLLMIHLFFVAVSLTASYGRSELTGRILQRFAFYTRLLNLELNLNYAPYYLTHAAETDVDHHVEVRLENAGDQWVALGSGSFVGGERYRRHLRFGRVMGLLSDVEAPGASQLAAGVARHFAEARGIPPVELRCRRQLLQDWTIRNEGTLEERDPHSRLYARFPYRANVVLLENGMVNVVKVESASEVALPGGVGEATP